VTWHDWWQGESRSLWTCEVVRWRLAGRSCPLTLSKLPLTTQRSFCTRTVSCVTSERSVLTDSKVQSWRSIKHSISARCTSQSARTVTWRSTEPVQATRQRSSLRCSFMVNQTPTHTTSSLPDWPVSFKTTTSVNCDSASTTSTPCGSRCTSASAWRHCWPAHGTSRPTSFMQRPDASTPIRVCQREWVSE